MSRILHRRVFDCYVCEKFSATPTNIKLFEMCTIKNRTNFHHAFTAGLQDTMESTIDDLDHGCNKYCNLIGHKQVSISHKNS